MRDIKFRAFDKKSGVVAEVVTIDYDQDAVCVRYEDDLYWVDFKDIELLQYTGLKDKNDVEIYEGDVIKVGRSNSYFDNDIAKVVFEDGCFLLKTVKLKYKIKEHFIKDFKNRGWYKIIGNIYENPELLEDNK